MFPIHVLYIRAGVYEVCSDDGRLSREFATQKEADIYANALRNGNDDLEALVEVTAYTDKKAKRNRAARQRNQLRKDMGLSRNRDGSWE